MFQDLIEAAKEQGGAPDQETMAQLAEEYLVGKASVYGTAAFYDFLKPENLGKEAYVCNGSTCLLAGTQDNKRRRHPRQHQNKALL